MRPAKVVHEPLGRTTHYQCTCGHREERRDSRPPEGNGDLSIAATEGFQEFP